MVMRSLRVVIIFISILLSYQLNAAVKGSETAVSIQSSFSFPAADNDNTLLGFGWFKNGFSFEDNSTTCTFNSVFPVSGSIDLKGGTLFLLQDLICRNVLQLDGLGTVCGHDHTLHFSSSVSHLPTNANIFDDIKVYLQSDLTINNTVTFKGNCLLCGVGSLLTLDTNGELVVDSNSRLELRDIEIRGIQDTKIRCVDDTATIILDNVRWVQSEFTFFKNGSFFFKDHVDFLGSNTLTYTSVMTSTIDVCSQLRIAQELHFCLGRDPDTLINPLAFTDETSTLCLDNCSFIITQSGLELTKGTIVINREVNLDAMGTTTQGGIILGNGIPEDDITIWLSPGAATFHNEGYWVYNNVASDKIKSSSKTARLIRSIGSKIYVPKSLEIKNLTVELTSALVSPIEVGASAQLSYNNAAVSLPDIQFDITSDQLNAFTYCLNGNDSLFLTKGTLPMYLVIMGTGNVLRGNGGVTGTVTLSNASSELTCGINGYIGNAITLNNGTINLDLDLLLRRGASVTGPGIINIGSNNLFFDYGFTANTPIYWEGNRGKIHFNSKITLTSTWTFKGSCTIFGKNAKLVLGEGGNIVVEDDSKLTFKNIELFGLADSNIRCNNDNGVITAISSDFHLSDDYLFDKGSMKFYLASTISGAYTFSYDSIHTSTIKTDGFVTLKDGITFDAGNKNGVQPLCFEDETTTLCLQDSNLSVRETGIEFTKGNLLIGGKVCLDIAGTTTQTGLILGTGNSNDDITIRLMGSSIITHNSGYWIYNNSVRTKMSASSNTARLVRNVGSKIYLPQSLEVDNFTIEVSSPLVAPIEVASNATLSYRTAGVRLPGIELEVTCDQLNAFTYLLNGNDSLFLTKGTFPLNIVVSGSGNQMIGNGGVAGTVTLSDKDTNFICGINGFIDNTLTLNEGTLLLNNDLHMHDNGKLIGPGKINLGQNDISFAPSLILGNSPIYWEGNGGAIMFTGRVSLSQTWTFKGKCVIEGVNSRLELADGGNIVIEDDSELILKNVRLHGLSEENLRCVNDSGKIMLISTDFVQSGDYRFTKGKMQFFLDNSISGAYTFSYDSSQTSTIKTDASLMIKDDNIFAIGRNNGNEPLSFEDKTSALKFQDCTFYVNETGMTITKGKLVADRDVVIHVCSNEESTGLTFGDGTAANDTYLILNPGVTARFPTGYLTANLTDPLAIRSKTKTAQMIRGPGKFNLKNNMVLKDLTVQVDALSALTITPGKTLSYDNGRIILEQGTFDLTGLRYNDVTSLLAGSDKIVLIHGSLPLATIVAGTNNSIEGTGNVTGPVILQNDLSELICNFNGCLFTNITMNGGTVTLLNDLNFANNVSLSGNGSVNLNSNNLNLGLSAFDWQGDIYWTGNQSSLSMHAKIDLSGTWTFQGDCEIKGHGQSLKLCGTGKIAIAPASRLCLHGVMLEAVRDHNIECLGDDSVLILDDAIWMQGDHSFTFTKGAIEFKNKTVMQGTRLFVYQTSMTSTICKDSKLKFDSGFTFSYDPVIASKSLLVFEDSSAELLLNSSTFHATLNGVQLTKGSIVVKGESYICSEVKENIDINEKIILTNEGIMLGDGISSIQDCNFLLTGGSILTLKQGALKYNNLLSTSWHMENDISILHISTGARLMLLKNLSLNSGTIVFDDKAIIAQRSGASLEGTIVPQGLLLKERVLK